MTATDLIKLKLERFRKQDPEDIHAMIQAESVSYEQFAQCVHDMRIDYLGDVRAVLLSAQIIVEQCYADRTEDFVKRFRSGSA